MSNRRNTCTDSLSTIFVRKDAGDKESARGAALKKLLLDTICFNNMKAHK